MFIVKTLMSETLADYVRRVRNAKGLSTQKVEELSRGGITDGYVSQIENGYRKNVSTPKLKALAKGLGVPEDEVFTIARGSKPKNTRLIDEICSYVAELTLPRQRDILSFSKLFYEEVINQQNRQNSVVIEVSEERQGEIKSVVKKERRKVNGK